MQRTSMALPRARTRVVVAQGVRVVKGVTVVVFVAAALSLAWRHGEVTPESRGSLGGPPVSSGS